LLANWSGIVIDYAFKFERNLEMKNEIQAAVSDIKSSLDLLRRHL